MSFIVFITQLTILCLINWSFGNWNMKAKLYRKEKIPGGRPQLLFSEVKESIRLCKTGNCGSFCENGSEFSTKARQFLTLWTMNFPRMAIRPAMSNVVISISESFQNNLGVSKKLFYAMKSYSCMKLSLWFPYEKGKRHTIYFSMEQ